MDKWVNEVKRRENATTSRLKGSYVALKLVYQEKIIEYAQQTADRICLNIGKELIENSRRTVKGYERIGRVLECNLPEEIYEPAMHDIAHKNGFLVPGIVHGLFSNSRWWKIEFFKPVKVRNSNLECDDSKEDKRYYKKNPETFDLFWRKLTEILYKNEVYDVKLYIEKEKYKSGRSKYRKAGSRVILGKTMKNYTEYAMYHLVVRYRYNPSN